MRPGRELDALVSEEVLKIPVIKDEHGFWPPPKRGANFAEHEIPFYSLDLTVAWDLLERLRGDYKVEISAYPDSKWVIKAFHHDGDAKSCTTSGETLSHAICLAALKSVKLTPENNQERSPREP